MPRNGTGGYVLPAGQPVASGTVISSSIFNALTSDLSVALTTSICTDGQTPMAANLPMGGNKVTNLASGSASGDAVNIGQLSATNGATLMGYLPSGTGGQTQTVASRLSQLVFTTDYDTLVDAKSAAGNNPVYDPVGIMHKDTFNNLANVFAESGETIWLSTTIQRAYENAGAHIGSTRAAHTIEMHPKGSGSSGPTNADYGLNLSILKQAFNTTSVVGELDALNIVLRNGGANSDSCGILFNVATYGTGFTALFEGQSSIIATGTTTKQIQAQAGVCDNVNNNYIGYFANANIGSLNAAFQVKNTLGASWSYLFQGYKDNIERYNVTNDGQINLFDSSSGKKTIRCNTNSLSILNAAGSIEIMNLSDAGNITSPGTITAGNFSTVGNISAASVGVTGNISTATIGATGNATVGGTLSVTGNLTIGKAGVTSYTPTLRATAGSYTTASATGHYYVLGTMCYVTIAITITSIGTGTVPIVGLPFTINGNVDDVTLAGRENAISGKACIGVKNTGTELQVLAYDNTNPAANGAVIKITGSYAIN